MRKALALAGLVSFAVVSEGAGLREVIVPASWAGEWTLTLESRDPFSGAVTDTLESSTTICPGDSVGLAMIVSRREGTECTGTNSGDRVGVACTAAFAHRSCRLEFRVDVDVARAGETLTGTGEWRLTTAAGDCSTLLDGVAPGESMRLSGTRTGATLAACSRAPQFVLEDLMSQSELVRRVPPPIVDLAARRDGSAFELSWSAVPQAQKYEVWRAKGTGRFKALALVRGATTYRDEASLPGLQHRYAVRWIAEDGRTSPMSNTVAGERP